MNLTNLCLLIAFGFSAWVLLRDDLASIPEGIILISLTCALISANN